MIKSSKAGEFPQAGGGAYSMPSKSTPGPSWDHRADPLEGQGLLVRMDESKDKMSSDDYADALSRAARWDDGDDRRIDSGNFPSDKDW